MTPLPAALGGADLVFWRIDRKRFASSWDNGEGAFQDGGRWNSPGTRAVYGALDPSTAILEVAVHKGFEVLDVVAHVLTSATITTPGDVAVISPDDLPNPSWLRSGWPSAGQQGFGDELLGKHRFFAIPSVVSANSWNLILSPALAQGCYALRSQEPLAIDTRLNPAPRRLKP